MCVLLCACACVHMCGWERRVYMCKCVRASLCVSICAFKCVQLCERASMCECVKERMLCVCAD